MDPDARAVDHDDIAIESLLYFFEDITPDAGLSPANEAVVEGGVGAIAFGHIGPRRTPAETPQNSVDRPSVIDTWHTARLVPQQRAQ